MSIPVRQNYYSIDSDTRSLISTRYRTITKAVNGDFWDSNSETDHSRYVGSYGRGTAINTSDLDVLIELPQCEYIHFDNLSSNGPSRLLQSVKQAIQDTYPRTDVRGDGQVVVVQFSDGMEFEILPAFKHLDYYDNWDGTYTYPNTHMGGYWLSTNPLAEQDAMKAKNGVDESNGLLFDTCKHIRYVKSQNFSSYHLSGILIDSFVYDVIGDWHWLRQGEIGSSNTNSYEQVLIEKYNNYDSWLLAPGSGTLVEVNDDDWKVLGKVLRMMA